MKIWDIAIIGGGTSGSFFARKMAEKGYSVKVIEKSSLEKVGSRYDIFHLGRKEFERFSIPRPVKGDKEWAFYYKKEKALYNQVKACEVYKD